MQGVDFVAIDFVTATETRTSICEAGICVVKDGRIVETRSWLVQPPLNRYNYFNTRIHGITANDTLYAPPFTMVWQEIVEYLYDCPILVAHNAAFDISCLRAVINLYQLETPAITYYCTLRAARRLYNFDCNRLDALCHYFDIPCENHHHAGNDAEMCARLFLRQLKDAGHCIPAEMHFCQGIL